MTSEPKDYKKPFFVEYRALVDEVEKLPASDQQTKIANMLHGLYNQMQENIEAQEGISEIQQLVILDNRSRLSALEEAQRWISVSERLPEEKGDYLCYLKPEIFTCFFGDSWSGTYAFRSVIAPTHWMPLPQPPESES